MRGVQLWGQQQQQQQQQQRQRQQQQKQRYNNHDFEYLYSMFTNHHICVVLQSSVHQIGAWKYPKSMHESKYT
jgi:hypothetical protein